MKYLSLVVFLFTLSFHGFSQTNSLLDRPNIHVEGYAFEEVTPDEIFIKVTIFDEKDKSVESKQTEWVKRLNELGVIGERITLMTEGENFGRLTWSR